MGRFASWISVNSHRLKEWVVLAVSGLVYAIPAHAASTRCDDLAPPQGGPVAGLHSINPEDLVRLRDIGRPYSTVYDETPLGLSPDGRRVAFQLIRADPASNGYCQGLFVMDAKPETAPRLIDQGGDLIRATIENIRGLVFPSGIQAIVTPVWSPDGRWIAYLKRLHGLTQAWAVAADGEQAKQVSHSDVDVEAVAWSADGRSLLFASRPGVIAEEKEIDREGIAGYHYDDRVAPYARARPFPRGPVPEQYFAVDLASGANRPASAAEQALIDSVDVAGRPAKAVLFAKTSQGGRAWTAPVGASRYPALNGLWATNGHGRSARCTDLRCDASIVGLWWTPDAKSVWFERREGWGKSEFAFYRWTPGTSAPHRTFATEDVLSGCVESSHQLLCLRDASTEPRQLVLFDPDHGLRRLVFDPNPEFASIRLGTVERLHWRNDQGVESYGDLVLPPDHRPGQRHPLIVVQYRTQGFLRGGTGDEYPIQAFAARGYAVLSFERPPPPADLAPKPGWKTWADSEPDNLKDWADRRSVLSSLVRGVQLAVSLGVADPQRIGLTGMSDGATTAQFALVNTRLFAAAALSSGTEDPKTWMTITGEGVIRQFADQGYPRSTHDDPNFWKPFSVAMNAHNIGAPILMQLSDDEYVAALEAFTALQEENRPVDLYIFPDEHHVKWQPAHRLAIYERNLDWFDFWLCGRIDPDPAKREQYERWIKLRADATANHTTGGRADPDGALSTPAPKPPHPPASGS